MWRYRTLCLLGFLLASCAGQDSSVVPTDSPDVAISQVDGPLAGPIRGALADSINARQPGTGPLLVAADQQFDPVSGATTPNPISVYVTATDDRGINSVELSLDNQSMGSYLAETDTQAFKNPFIFPSRRSGLSSVPIPGSSSGLVGSVLRAQTENRDGTPSEEAVLELQADGSRPNITFSATSSDSPFTTESFVTLTGQTSDPETGVVDFAAFLDGAELEINPATPFAFDSVQDGLEAGTHTVRLVATNGVLVPNEAVFTFSVIEAPEEPGEGNQQPVVSLLAAPTLGEPPLAVSFTASASDPDGDEVTYLYDFGDGVTTAGAPAASHTYTEAGTYIAKVTVNDGKGGTASAETTITVGDGGSGNGGENQAPTVSIEGEATRTANPNEALDLTATAIDPNDDMLTYSWAAEPSEGVTFSPVSERKTKATFASARDYTVTVSVDDGTNEPVSDEISVIVGSGEDDGGDDGGDDNGDDDSGDNGGVDAVDDAATTEPGEPVTIDVLSNDKPSVQALIIISATSPSEGGTVAISRDKKIIDYTPQDGFTGEDSFRYIVRDADDNKATATVTVQVE